MASCYHVFTMKKWWLTKSDRCESWFSWQIKPAISGSQIPKEQTADRNQVDKDLGWLMWRFWLSPGLAKAPFGMQKKNREWEGERLCSFFCPSSNEVGHLRGYPPKIWPYMVQYLHFIRILKFPLIKTRQPTPHGQWMFLSNGRRIPRSWWATNLSHWPVHRKIWRTLRPLWLFDWRRMVFCGPWRAYEQKSLTVISVQFPMHVSLYSI